jgi:hypothetical protein
MIAKERIIFSPGKSGNRVAEEELKSSRVQRQKRTEAGR